MELLESLMVNCNLRRIKDVRPDTRGHSGGLPGNLARKINDTLLLNKSYVLEVVYSRDKDSYVAYICRKKTYKLTKEVVF